MLIIAKTVKGKEFMYSIKSARKVSKASAEKILAIVNAHKEILGAKEDEIFHIYEIDEYDTAYAYAQYQSFTIRNGIVTARNYF